MELTHPLMNPSIEMEKPHSLMNPPIEMEKNMNEEEKPYKPIKIKLKESYWIDGLSNNIKTKHQNKSPSRKSHERGNRRMLDSYMEEFLPFTSNSDLLDDYINPFGGIRMGKIFEELDLLAANVAYRHCAMYKEDLTIVTASIDRIDLIKPITICDMRISGHVSYVGNSSMEVLVRLEALQDGVYHTIDTSSDYKKSKIQGETLIMARFSMVARDPFTSTSVLVNHLLLETDDQKKLSQIAKKQRDERRALTKLPPTEEEKRLVHDLQLEYTKYTSQKEKMPQNIVWMDETVMESTTITQPQDRNTHGFAFGGYLIKLAYELAISNASIFLKSVAAFLSLDEVSFKKPVPVGSILGMHSQIVYAPGSPHRNLQVTVTADVLDFERGKRETTNIFHFTFKCEDPAIEVKRVLPKNPIECKKYLEGKRRHQISVNETSKNDERIQFSSKL